jgi:hypothetical protein
MILIWPQIIRYFFRACICSVSVATLM